MLDAMKVIAQDVDRDAKAAAEALAKKKATIHPGIKLLDDAPAGGGAVGGADPGATLPPPRRKPCLGCYNTLRATRVRPGGRDLRALRTASAKSKAVLGVLQTSGGSAGLSRAGGSKHAQVSPTAEALSSTAELLGGIKLAALRALVISVCILWKRIRVQTGPFENFRWFRAHTQPHAQSESESLPNISSNLVNGRAFQPNICNHSNSGSERTVPSPATEAYRRERRAG
jgi:hypothetical protein